MHLLGHDHVALVEQPQDLDLHRPLGVLVAGDVARLGEVAGICREHKSRIGNITSQMPVTCDEVHEARGKLNAAEHARVVAEAADQENLLARTRRRAQFGCGDSSGSGIGTE